MRGAVWHDLCCTDTLSRGRCCLCGTCVHDLDDCCTRRQSGACPVLECEHYEREEQNAHT